jgi:ATP-binding cassette subfamily B protein
MLFMGGIMLFLVWQVLNGSVDVADAGIAIAAVQMLGNRIDLLTMGISSLYETSLFLEDFTSFLKLKPAIDESRSKEPAPSGFEEIAVHELEFAYPGSKRKALKGLDLKIRRGEVVALVGENGSGKTTLAKLLGCLFRPTGGSVTWDGVDITTYEPQSVRDSIAVIFQDFVKYKLTAHENVGLGDYERADDLEAVRAAASAAGADGFLSKLKNGYQTILSKEFKGGRDLSVGQWQKVALARAFFRDASFIILDEPTAALDPRAERELFDNIRDLTRGKTVLLISHRFSSVRHADRTFVLDKGELIEEGTHEELMALDGLYAELFKLQASSYLGEDARTS